MARRKRLNPVAALNEPGALAPRRAPIAEVAGESSAAAALSDLAEEVAAARAAGRMIEPLPIDAIESGHLIRDRLGAEDDELSSLVESIRARGQQVPLEVTDLGQGRYGLISGWRRLTALRRLHAETGEARFATALVVLRRPETASDAYVAMIEENEIRLGLSYYERARVAARAAEAGVFASPQAAIAVLFAAGSKAKRSKILSFVSVYEALDDVLAYPAAIPERLGLKLSAAIAEGRGGEIRQALMRAAAPDAKAEMAALSRAVAPKTPGAPAPGQDSPEVAPGIRLSRGRRGLTLSGPGVDDRLRADLESWLAARTG